VCGAKITTDFLMSGNVPFIFQPKTTERKNLEIDFMCYYLIFYRSDGTRHE
jgi:hypothetical protein